MNASREVESALVTGGAGFIGSHLVRRLCDLGVSVTILDDLSQGVSSNLDSRAEFVFGSVQDHKACRRATQGVDTVFHLAAMSRSGPSLDAMNLCLDANVVGTAEVLGASLEAGVSKFVYSASSTCYGNAPTPHGLTSEIQLLNPYGWSKFAGEQLALMTSRTSDISATSLRYFNVYGPGEPKEGPYALVIGIFVERAAKNLPLEIHGDGQQSRDFIHVSDVVEANLAAARRRESGEIFNVGSGTGVSILEIAKMISDNLEWGPARPADSRATLADIGATLEKLRWTPKVPLAQGVAEAVARSRERP